MKRRKHTITSLMLVNVTVMLLTLVGATGAEAQVPLDCNKFLAANQVGELFSVDPNDGTSLFIGNVPATTEVEFDIVTGTLFGEGSNGDSRLFDIDPSTGVVNGFVTHLFGALNGMEYVNSVLYATFIEGPQGPSRLVIVDVNTGNLTFVGLTGFGPISGLAYDKSDGTMWGVTAPVANLVNINLMTGAATLVGPLVDVTGQQLNRVGSIEFGPDGELYGGLTGSAVTLPRHIVQIDTATGIATPVGDTGFSITGLTSCFDEIEVAIDIKPTSCPNPLNLKSNGVLPVAVLSTEQFDVTQVDPETVRLIGVAPLRWAIDDVATPYEPFVGKEDAFDCTNDPGDGYLDLTLKFATQEVVAALGEVSDGEVVVLPLTANLKEEYGGTPIAGEDVVVILKKGK